MFEIAFKMFDLNGDGDVVFEEYEKVWVQSPHFTQCSSRHAKLGHDKLWHAQLRRAKLGYAKLEQAKLEHAKLELPIYDTLN